MRPITAPIADPRTQIRGLIEATAREEGRAPGLGLDPRTQIRGLIEATALAIPLLASESRSADSDPRPH